MQEKYTVNLMKDGSIVGNIGSYPSKREAQSIALEFNVKFKRRAGKAVVTELNEQKEEEKPKPNPRRSTQALFLSKSNQEEESEEEESEEYEDSEEESEDYQYSEEESEEEQRTPIFTPRQQPREPIVQNKPKSRYKVPHKTADRPFMFGYGAQNTNIVLIDDEGYVALIENRAIRGPKWIFMSSDIESHDSPQEKMIEDVESASGYKNEIISRIEASYISGKKIIFYLARPTRMVHDPREEIAWVSQDEAYDLLGRNIGQNKTILRRILDKAFSIWRKKQL